VVNFLLIPALYFHLDPVSLELEGAHSESGAGFKLIVSILPARLELEVLRPSLKKSGLHASSLASCHVCGRTAFEVWA
jgi:hypothetical protein